MIFLRMLEHRLQRLCITRICLAFQQRTDVLVYMLVFQRFNIFQATFPLLSTLFQATFIYSNTHFWGRLSTAKVLLFLIYANYLAILLHFRYFLYQFKNPPFHHLASLTCVTIPSLNYSSPVHWSVVIISQWPPFLPLTR